MPLQKLLQDMDPVKKAELLWRISLPIMCALLMIAAIPLGFVNPRVGRSANLIVALLSVIIYLNIVNISQATVSQGRSEFSMTWWPVHLAVLVSVISLFAWRLKVNSRWHPLVMWSRCKAGLRGKEKLA